MDPVVCAAAILTTLLDVEPDTAPSGVVFSALNGRGCSHHVYSNVLGALVNHGLVNPGFELSLTDKGRETAKECNALIS